MNGKLNLVNFATIFIVTVSKILQVSSFHIPSITLDTDLSIQSDNSNHGLINSAIINNWTQSLNIGSVSIACCILLLLLGLILYLKLADRISRAEDQILKSMNNIKEIQNASNLVIRRD